MKLIPHVVSHYSRKTSFSPRMPVPVPWTRHRTVLSEPKEPACGLGPFQERRDFKDSPAFLSQ